MDTLNDIACFVAVIERGSFTAAAGHLGLSRSAVSKQVSHLENRLHARLLNRSTRRLSLTEAGQTFSAGAQRGLHELAEAEAAVSRLQAEPRGILRVNAPMSFGILQLAPAVPAFLSRFPQVQLDMRLDDRKLDLIDDAYDVAIRIGDLPESSLVARRLGACPHVLCATPAYLRTHGEPATPDDLRSHNAITFSYQDSPSQWTFTGRDGKRISVGTSYPGDLIIEVNRANVESVKDFKSLIDQHKNGDGINLLVKRMNAGLLVIRLA